MVLISLQQYCIGQFLYSNIEELLLAISCDDVHLWVCYIVPLHCELAFYTLLPGTRGLLSLSKPSLCLRKDSQEIFTSHFWFKCRGNNNVGSRFKLESGGDFTCVEEEGHLGMAGIVPEKLCVQLLARLLIRWIL